LMKPFGAEFTPGVLNLFHARRQFKSYEASWVPGYKAYLAHKKLPTPCRPPRITIMGS